MTESEEELKSLLMKVKGESQKAGLKLNIVESIYDKPTARKEVVWTREGMMTMRYKH